VKATGISVVTADMIGTTPRILNDDILRVAYSSNSRDVEEPIIVDYDMSIVTVSEFIKESERRVGVRVKHGLRGEDTVRSDRSDKRCSPSPCVNVRGEGGNEAQSLNSFFTRLSSNNTGRTLKDIGGGEKLVTEKIATSLVVTDTEAAASAAARLAAAEASLVAVKKREEVVTLLEKGSLPRDQDKLVKAEEDATKAEDAYLVASRANILSQPPAMYALNGFIY